MKPDNHKLEMVQSMVITFIRVPLPESRGRGRRNLKCIHRGLHVSETFTSSKFRTIHQSMSPSSDWSLFTKAKPNFFFCRLILFFILIFSFLLFCCLLVCPIAGANTAVESFTFSFFFFTVYPPQKKSNQMILDAMAPISTIKI